MDHVVHKIWHWVISKNNWLSAIHIAGVLNEEADEESRQQELRTEWVLNRQDFKFVVEKLGFIITVNLFVSYINTLQFQLKAPLLNNFWIFCRSPLSYLDPPPPIPILLISQILFCRYFRDCQNRLFYLQNCKQLSSKKF